MGVVEPLAAQHRTLRTLRCRVVLSHHPSFELGRERASLRTALTRPHQHSRLDENLAVVARRPGLR